MESIASEIGSLNWDEIPFLCFDTETTGFERHDRVVEVGIVVATATEVLSTYTTRINPGFPMPEDASRVNGITDDDLRDAPRVEDVLPHILKELRRDTPWVAHNMSFDARMLSYSIPVEDWPRDIPTLCTLDFARHRHPLLRYRRGHRLAEVASHLGVRYEQKNLHSAIGDAELLARIVPVMMRGRQVRDTFTRLSQDWLSSSQMS